MRTALFYLRAWWPMWMTAAIFMAFTLWLLMPVDRVLAFMLAPLLAVAGWFSMGLVLASADYSDLV